MNAVSDATPNSGKDIDQGAFSIAASNERVLRVLAGPGTGKTFAIKRRVMRLLEDGSKPQRILAVTFTRTSAHALVRELATLGVAGCEKIRAMTLHSFCLGLLNRQEVFEAINRTARPLISVGPLGTLGFEYCPLLEDLDNQSEFGGKRDRIGLLRAHEAAWARQQHDDPGWVHNDLERKFAAALVDWLRFHHAMLIGEVIPEALRYLRNNPTAPELSAFDHILVDEYQDLNKAEQSLIDIMTANCNLVVVGDDNQSIYSFRFAHPEGIIEFSTRRSESVDKTLTECRRCPTSVVTMANSLIAWNHLNRSARKLLPRAGNPVGDVRHIQWSSIEEETQGLAAFINALITKQRYTPGDIMVLCPRRHIGYMIRDALRNFSIAVHSYYHEEALEEPEAQESFALLTLLVEPEDRVALRFWLGCKSPTFLTNQYSKLRLICNQSDRSPFDTLTQMQSGAIPSKGMRGIKARFDVLTERLAALRQMPVSDVMDCLYPPQALWARPVRDILEENASTLQDARTALEILTGYITQPEVPADPNFVRVMSLHKSKGLTSKVVIVTSAVEGLIPTLPKLSSPAEEQAALAEARRLLYVAITRTSEMLVLSSVSSMPFALAKRLGAKVGRSGHTTASRFLAELGPTLPKARRGTEWAAAGFN
jgi:DNA helicase-2/ATP-dependent DNA helicase PcrA